MTESIGRYAQMKVDDNKVINVIKMNDLFLIEGCCFMKIPDGIPCSEGSYYNSSDGFFYDDSEFKIISGTSTVNEIS